MSQAETLPSKSGLGEQRADSRIIVALDVPNASAAQEMVRRIGDSANFYKVGLQLFAAEGPSVVRELVASGRKVFLDLKLHDIPNTVAGGGESRGGTRGGRIRPPPRG